MIQYRLDPTINIDELIENNRANILLNPSAFTDDYRIKSAKENIILTIKDSARFITTLTESNRTIGRIIIPKEFWIPDYPKFWGIKKDNSKDVIIGTKIYKHTTHYQNMIEFTTEEYTNYTPDLKLFRLKALRNSELATNIPTKYEYLLERETQFQLDINLLNAVTIVPLTADEKPFYVKIADLEIITPDMKDTRKDPIRWSDPKTRTLSLKEDYIKEQLRVRYAMFDRPREGLSNVILDSFVPKLLYKSNFCIERISELIDLPKTSVAISPWFANILGIKQAEPEQLCRILGYDKKTLNKLFMQVRYKNLDLVMVGFGGTSINTIHWLYEIAKFTNSINLFNSIAIYEPDAIEVSNLLRFPIDPFVLQKYSPYPYKTELLNGELNRLAKDYTIVNRYFTPTNARLSNNYIVYNNTTVRSDTTIIYGAPDIETRQKLSSFGNFITATHSNNSCRIDLNPHQNSTLQVESYGIISLSAFFMNQLKMAISFLELLASDQDLLEQDKTILEYQFDGKSLLSTDRQYNFQLSHSGLVSTREEAETDV